jgi:hypothetical protein
VNHKLLVHAKSLKAFLSLFEEASVLQHLSLGDTLHASSGFVDAEILDGKRTVTEIINYPYDFDGLVEFICEIGALKTRLTKQDNSEYQLYEIEGEDFKLREIINKIITKNALTPDEYAFRLVVNGAGITS